MKKLNIGFIGAGSFISSTHLRTAAETDFINIAAIADLNRERLNEHAKKYELLLVPSDSFGYSGYIRIAYCVSKKQIINSLPAFKKLIEEYKELV